MKENTLATNFEPQECVIFIKSVKIGTTKIKPSTVTFLLEHFNINIEEIPIRSQSPKGQGKITGIVIVNPRMHKHSKVRPGARGE